MKKNEWSHAFIKAQPSHPDEDEGDHSRSTEISSETVTVIHVKDDDGWSREAGRRR